MEYLRSRLNPAHTKLFDALTAKMEALTAEDEGEWVGKLDKIYQNAIDARGKYISVQRDLDETAVTSFCERLVGRDRLLDDIQTILAYGAPTPGDAFEVDLAAETPSGNLPLWAAQIKNCRLKDGDWIEGGPKHRRMILRYLHRHDVEYEKDFAERPKLFHLLQPDDLKIPTAVFRVLRLWKSMFLQDGRFQRGEVQYEARKDVETLWREMEAEDTVALHNRIIDPDDSIHDMSAVNYVGIHKVVALAGKYYMAMRNGTDNMSALDDNSFASSSRHASSRKIGSRTSTPPPTQGSYIMAARAGKPVPATAKDKNKDKAQIEKKGKTENKGKTKDKGKGKAKATPRSSTGSYASATTVGTQLCDCYQCSTGRFAEDLLDGCGCEMCRSMSSSSSASGGGKPAKSRRSFTVEAEVTTSKADGDGDNVVTLKFPPISIDRMKESARMFQERFGINMGL